MKFGLNGAEHKYIEGKVVLPLKKLGFSVYVFGSRARGDHSSFSDLDLMLDGKVSGEARRIVSELKEELSLGSFPYKVDLVFLADFASSYLSEYEKEKCLWS